MSYENSNVMFKDIYLMIYSLFLCINNNIMFVRVCIIRIVYILYCTSDVLFTITNHAQYHELLVL